MREKTENAHMKVAKFCNPCCRRKLDFIFANPKTGITLGDLKVSFLVGKLGALKIRLKVLPTGLIKDFCFKQKTAA